MTNGVRPRLKTPPAQCDPPLPHQRARTMRNPMTRSEYKLWSALRGKKVAGLRFRRQHPIGPFFADFACLAARLVVEVDGNSHLTREQVEYDVRRTAYLRRAGYEVMRFWNVDVLTRLDIVIVQIEAAVAARVTARDESKDSGRP